MSVISTLLTPYKGYIYGGLAVFGLSVFGWYTVHERDVQKAKDTAAELSEVKVIARKDVLIEQTADATVAQQEAQHEQTNTAPPESNIGVVCHDTGADPVPAAAAGNGPGGNSTDRGAGDLFDPSGDLGAIGRKYDAWVKQLQTDNAALRQELADAAKERK